MKKLLSKLLYSLLILSSLHSNAQQPDVKGYVVDTKTGDTLFLTGYYKSIGPIVDPPVSPCGIKGIRRYITPASWGGAYINANGFQYNPGDTLVLKGQWLGGLDIENFHGTAQCPIVIINEGDVKLGAGFKLSHCTYMKITGSGSSSQYGFYIHADNGTGVAIEITGRSSNIEVERISVHKKAYGAWVKQEAACPDSLKYPNWWIDNISLHNCKFQNIGQDCLYFGSTSPTGQRSISCNGQTIFPIPLRLSNIRIYDNYIDSCNRTGIQLSGGDRGDNRIYNNTVLRCGYELNQTQGSGIILGGMTRAWVYNNYIRQTFMHGIFLLGSGLSTVEKNNIDSSGLLGKIANSFQPTGIFADTRATVPVNDSTTLIIRNNVLGSNTVIKGEHIIMLNTNKTFTNRNVISGNTTQAGQAAKIYTAPDIVWKTQ